MSETVDVNKLRVLFPEDSITVTITYKDQDVAQAMYDFLISPNASVGFSEPKIENSMVTVKCKNWTSVNLLERLARTIKMHIFEKKFGKI